MTKILLIRNGLVHAAGCFILAMFFCATAAPAKEFADLELVLAVDISLSMDTDEQRLQREGYVAAFRDTNIIKAIQSGPNGRIAVTYVEWAGAGTQLLVVPWRVISSASEANRFADDLAVKPQMRARMTSISEAIEYAAHLFTTSPVTGLRRVIDVSGDGPNNAGQLVERSRDKIVASGIIINGLAIQIGRSYEGYGFFDLPDLDRYYKDCVIGGPGAFVLSIRKPEEFATAIRQKLLLEIADETLTAPPSISPLKRVQFQPPLAKYDCTVGEKRWQQYRNDSGDQY